MGGSGLRNSRFNRWFGQAGSGLARNGLVILGVARYGTVRQGKVECGKALGWARFGVARYGTVRRVKVECGPVWHGKVILGGVGQASVRQAGVWPVVLWSGEAG